jgi:hypothetical protein
MEDRVMITVVGPNWKTTRALRAALKEVPEEGIFTFGGRDQDKLRQLTVLRGNRVQTVDYVKENPADPQYWFGNPPARQDLWLGRKRRHTRGKDIVRPEHPRWGRSDFWTKYTPSAEEWRVHIFDGKSIARGKKVWVKDGPEPEVKIRSRSRGYHMVHDVEYDSMAALRKFAKEMVNTLGWSFGACDVLIGQGGEMYALEANSAPAMDDYTLAAYVKAIRKRFSNAD